MKLIHSIMNFKTMILAAALLVQADNVYAAVPDTRDALTLSIAQVENMEVLIADKADGVYTVYTINPGIESDASRDGTYARPIIKFRELDVGSEHVFRLPKHMWFTEIQKVTLSADGKSIILNGYLENMETGKRTARKLKLTIKLGEYGEIPTELLTQWVK